MDSSQLFTTNIVLIVLSLLVFTIFLLLSFIFTEQKHERLHMLFTNLAFVCIPAFLIGVADRVFLIRYFLNDTEQLIDTRIVKPFGNYTGNLAEYGLKGMQPPLDFNVIFNEMKPGGTLLILDTVIPDIHRAFPSIRAALDRGVKVQILVAHPESQIAKFRALEMGPVWDYNKSFRPAIYGYISHIQAIVLEDREKRSKLVEMRYYEDLPGLPMYILDNPGENEQKLYHGFFLARASVEAPHVEIVRTRNGIFENFEKYFQEKWERNKGNKIDLLSFSGPGSLPKPRYGELQ